jgi:molybdopterin molybdotransferase
VVTGNELVPAGTPLRPGQIHDSNSAVLRAMLAPFAESLTLYGPVVDEIDVLRQTLHTAAASHDIVVTAGGASAGRADFVPALVRELGEIRLWKVATRPGMPFLHGRVGEATIYGLPGNPVSVFASMLTLVIPALQAMLAMTPTVPERAMLLAATAKSHARVEWRRGQLTTTIDARRVILPHTMLGSGMLRGVAESNALFRLDAETRALGAGALVEVIPFPA